MLLKSVILFIIYINLTNGQLSVYFNSIGEYFGYKNTKQNVDNDDFTQRIPYEVSTIDEKFINEAASLTGVALSELDSCQQRVVLKLQSDCSSLNDEQVSKLAVALLNCQSYAEGRDLFPCSEEMSLRDCTRNMDPDTWTTYHLMTNRARAVCYTIRQSQFRGLAEHTVNRLMKTAHDQLHVLLKIASNQDNLHTIALKTKEDLEKGHEELLQQQADLKKAQFHGQLTLENNINKLVEEKKLIMDTHKELLSMTHNLQDKLEKSALQMESQDEKSRINHQELINDLVKIQKKTNELFLKIDESAQLLIKQNEDFRQQYTSTLKNLAEVNKTVHDLVNLVGGTRQALEERLAWITTALGGTDVAVERLYLILWHSIFLITAMLSCAFLNAHPNTRFLVVTLPSLNLVVALYGETPYLDKFQLTMAVFGLYLVKILLLFLLKLRKVSSQPQALTDKSPNLLQEKISSNTSHSTYSNQSFHLNRNNSHLEQEDDYFDTLTPPESRTSHYSVRSRSRSNTPLKLNSGFRGACHAKTRMGTPCKLSSLPGRDYCYRHQSGDSVMG